MFCSKCGSRIADDAKFCSVCGARTVSTGLESATEHPVSRTQYSEKNVAPKTNHTFSLDLDWDSVESQPAKKSSSMDFDWSSVVEERRPKKKVTKNIRSPWEDSSDSYEMTPRTPSASSYRAPEKKTSLEEELFGKEEPSRDRSRTMNFIDVLKQEKDEQARAEYEKVRSESARYNSVPPTAHPAAQKSVLPENQREHTQGYTDLKDDILAGLEQSEPKELSFEEQLASIRAERQEAQRQMQSRPVEPAEDSEAAFEKMLSGMKHGFDDSAEEEDELSSILQNNNDRFTEPTPAKDPVRGRNTMFREYENSFESIDDYDDIQLNNLEDDVEPAQAAPETSSDEPNVFFNDYYGEDDVVLNPQELDDESEAVTSDVDLFSDAPSALDYEMPNEEEANVEDAYSEFDEYLDYMVPRRASRTSSRAARAQEEMAFEDDDDEDLYDSFDVALKTNDDDLDEDETPNITAEPPVDTESLASMPSDDTPETVDDEIAVLQKQLEMLMKQKAGETVAVEPESAASTEVTTPSDVPATEEAPVAAESEQAPVENTVAESVAPAVPETPVAEAPVETLVEEVAPVQEEPAPVATAEPEATPSEDAFASMDQLDLDAELAQLGFYLGDTEEPASAQEEPKVETKEESPLFNIESTPASGNGTDTVVLPEEELKSASSDDDFMSLEKMENDIFGASPDEDDLEATRKIDKFYTLYRKNEEFQKLLDEEYNKLQGGDIDDDVQDSIDAILGRSDAAAAAVSDPTSEGIPAAQPVMETPEIPVTPAQAPASNDVAFAKAANEAAVKESRKKVKKKKAETEEYSGKGGSILTVIAIVVAVLLVVLLAIILILNFMPESGIAQSLNEIIGNYTNFFADGGGDTLL